MSVTPEAPRDPRMGMPDSGWRRFALSTLIYGLFVFVPPALSSAGWLTWALTIGSLLAFVAFYLDFLWQGVGLDVDPALGKRTRRALVDLAAITGLGFALVPFNVGGVTYLVYSAALAPLVLPLRRSIGFFVLLAGGVAVELALIPGSDRLVIGGWVIFLIFIVGGGNLFMGDRMRQMALLRRAQEDVEEMAKVAERERIARDLHDVLGHTLSVIALKSELAARLADSDPRRAAEEIREVEQVSRDALAEVRRAVEGYRGRGLAGELLKVEQTLTSGGVRLETDVVQLQLSARQETVLSLALREAVTNVIRHARASVCGIELRKVGGEVVLTIRDDGVGGLLREGFGLAGMRERVAGAGGVMSVDGTRGVLVTVRLPATVPVDERVPPS